MKTVINAVFLLYISQSKFDKLPKISLLRDKGLPHVTYPIS